MTFVSSFFGAFDSLCNLWSGKDARLKRHVDNAHLFLRLQYFLQELFPLQKSEQLKGINFYNKFVWVFHPNCNDVMILDNSKESLVLKNN